MIIVSDASPLIALAVIGKLDLLRRLYGQVFVPDAVFREVVGASPLAPGATEIQDATWIIQEEVGDSALVEQLAIELDEGEAAAIALAIEKKAAVDGRASRTCGGGAIRY